VKKIVKIDQFLSKMWTKCNSLLFWPTTSICNIQQLAQCLSHQCTIIMRFKKWSF